MKDQWIITVDGDPVEGTNAYTRATAIAQFRQESKTSWEHYRAAGYKVVRLKLKE